MRRPDGSVILEIEGNKFKKARKEKNRNKDTIFCEGADQVCFTFSLDVMEQLLNKIKNSPELQEKFGVVVK